MSDQYDEKEVEEILSKFPLSKDNENATKKLLESFPEFKNSEFYGQTGQLPYLVFADFCRFVLHKIKITGTNNNLDILLKRVGEFIVELYFSNSEDLKDLVRAGMFEDLSNDPKSVILLDFLPSEVAMDFKSFF
jgi:hypothetical protein